MSINYMKCPFCGYQVEDGLTVCRGCQAEISYETASDIFFRNLLPILFIAYVSTLLIITIFNNQILAGIIGFGIIIGSYVFIRMTHPAKKPVFRRTFR